MRGVAGRCVLAALLLSGVGCAEPSTAPVRASEAEAGTWPTFLLPSASAVRPAPPPADGSPAQLAELAQVVAAQQAWGPGRDSLVRRYDGDPTSLWTQTAVDLLGFYWAILPDVRIATPARSARLMALLHVAMHDAVIASWEAKWAYRRVAPARGSARVRALVPVGDLPSYPSEHAAVAAAALGVLRAVALPGDTARLAAQMDSVGLARVASGAAYPSDVEAGYALGRAVAARVLAYAATDRADTPWDRALPPGPNTWVPTPPRRVQVPFDAMAGTWRTWVIPRGDAYRPPPHPAPESFAFRVAQDELRRLASGGATTAQMDRARFWATEAPTARWDLFVEAELARRRWSVPRTARARAWVSIAMYDAFVACWDAKFHYWLARPVTMDPALRTIFATPPFPSYPSGHSTISTAAAQVMAMLFPDKATAYHDLAVEASNSRVWGGVHYRFDIEWGDTLGTQVGRAVVARMRALGVR